MWKEWISFSWPKNADGGSKWRAGTRYTQVRLDDGLKLALGNRGMTVKAARQCAKDKKELVHM